MKFIADVMVGRLAKYLRMAGIDVLYENDMDDQEIINTAMQENRIILTRDNLMLQRRECKRNIIKSILIKDDNIIGQLKQVNYDLKIDLKPNLIRCIECNLPLQKAEKQKIRGLVPPYVFKTQDNFLYCSHCRKYYWRGTHYKNISNVFKTARSL